MLQLDPNKRISAAEALNHPYFTNDPLPCKPYELPRFKGDFHEYTVRKDRKEMKSKQNFEKKVSHNSKNHEYPKGNKQWSKSRGHSNSFSKSGSNFKNNHYKSSAHDKSLKTYEKNQGEGQLSGIKRTQMPQSKPKEHDTKVKLLGETLNNKKTRYTPGLLSLANSANAPSTVEDKSKLSETKDYISMLKESHKKTKKRDLKDEHKRGSEE